MKICTETNKKRNMPIVGNWYIVWSKALDVYEKSSNWIWMMNWKNTNKQTYTIHIWICIYMKFDIW